MEDLPWKSQHETYKDALKYLKGRQTGEITSLKTKWDPVNKATLDGFEWQSTNILGGRPGTGKTCIKDQILRDAFDANPEEDMRALEFSMEMVGRVSAIRGYSAHLGNSYKYLCSAEDGVISDEELEQCRAHAKTMLKYNIDVIETAPSIKGFEKIIDRYMKHYATKVEEKNPETGVMITKLNYTNTIITVDHSLLFEKGAHQNRNDMLNDLGTALTRIKRKYPVIFLILSQLNRSIDHPDRNEDGKYGNYVLDSDIFGSDALLQHADMVIGLNIPGKQKIKFYGPHRYIVPADERLLAMHFLKARNGAGGVTFFQTSFDKMRIDPVPLPAKHETRSRGYN